MRTRFRAAAAAVFAISIGSRIEAQHEPHHPAQRDTSAHADSMMQMPMPEQGMRPGVLGIPMTRMGSGTSWLPDAAPMHAVHFQTGSWAMMVHGVVFGM
jgi:hypothetical protein